MAQMNISIPDQLKAWVETRVADGAYSSTSDYVRDLVRQDQRDGVIRARLQAAIDAGRATGRSTRSLQDIVAEARRKFKPCDKG